MPFLLSSYATCSPLGICTSSDRKNAVYKGDLQMKLWLEEKGGKDLKGTVTKTKPYFGLLHLLKPSKGGAKLLETGNTLREFCLLPLFVCFHTTGVICMKTGSFNAFSAPAAFPSPEISVDVCSKDYTGH